MSLPPLFIAFASITLLLALVALWNSFRVALGSAMAGDAGSHGLTGSDDLPDRAALLDEKKSLLRAIKDLEYEHAVGKISADDFKRLDVAYRVRAKEVLALLDKDLLPYQQRAEALLAASITASEPKKSKKTPKGEVADDADASEEALRERARALRDEAARLERLAAASDAKVAAAKGAAAKGAAAKSAAAKSAAAKSTAAKSTGADGAGADGAADDSAAEESASERAADDVARSESARAETASDAPDGDRT